MNASNRPAAEHVSDAASGAIRHHGSSARARAIGILLAAGAGTRYGQPKVLAEDGDWLAKAVAALSEGGCDDVVVVLGAARPPVPAPARAILAEDWQQGMSASLKAGLRAADGTDADYAVLHVVDTPDVGADVVARVLQAATQTGLARATFGARPGHPVVIARRHWQQVSATARGDLGARTFLENRDDVVAVDCADLAGGHDIDQR